MTCRRKLFSYNIVGLHTDSLKATCAIRMGKYYCLLAIIAHKNARQCRA